MIELYELRQFVTFADTGTLSEAADVFAFVTAGAQPQYEKA